MEKNNTDVLQAAEKFGVSVHTVKKWLRLGQKDCRVPRPAMQAKIREMTDGDVMPNDWVV
jgi:transposase